jgi:hypothetical protein
VCRRLLGELYERLGVGEGGGVACGGTGVKKVDNALRILLLELELDNLYSKIASNVKYKRVSYLTRSFKQTLKIPIVTGYLR